MTLKRSAGFLVTSVSTITIVFAPSLAVAQETALIGLSKKPLMGVTHDGLARTNAIP